MGRARDVPAEEDGVAFLRARPYQSRMPTVDFGVAAEDYARHRPGFPDAFFDHVRTLGMGLAGQRVLDVGTGTGTLALGFARRGCDAVGLDPSGNMLAQARRLAIEQRLTVRWVEARAEATGMPAESFDLVCAGQCWHWFDRGAVAAEARRVLRPGARALIAYFSYLPEEGSLAQATERIVLRHNPTWAMAGLDGQYPRLADDLTGAGFERPSTFDFIVNTPFTHEAWRGRFRACHGVLTLPPDAVGAFDSELAALLETYPEPVLVPHRIFGIVARRS